MTALALAVYGLLIAATEHYQARVGVVPELVEPLFYSCWMHRALKESTRLTAGNLERHHRLPEQHPCEDCRHHGLGEQADRRERRRKMSEREGDPTLA